MLYTRPQLKLLLTLALVLLVGLAVREWRAGFPDAADRLERFDREEAPPSPPLIAPRSPATSPPRSAPTAAAQGPSAPQPDTPVVMRAAKPPPSTPLDLNRASAEELARLPGVGLGLAQRILDERERRGRFDSPEALRHVLGLGPKKLGAIRDLVTVSDAP